MRKRFRILLTAIVLIIAVSAFVLLTDYTDGGGYPAVQFCGGAREVGGSCYLVETGKTRFVVDCGTFSEAGKDVLPPEPENLDFALLTHAHGDHCGLLPELFAAGFSGPVYCTEPTARLAAVMLSMARSFKRERVDRDDYSRALAGFKGVKFNEPVWKDDVLFEFSRAEHLLGAAYVEISIRRGSDTLKVVFSGDLGDGNSVLLRPLSKCRRADYVVMESTYGGTEREDLYEDPVQRHVPFAEAVGEALRRGGDVLIPAFTLGRTQEVIAVIDDYQEKGLIPAGALVYTDSPTAEKITSIYREFTNELSSRARGFYGDGILRRATLREVRSKSSLKVHVRKHRPSIFISSSGDLNHANSPRHLMKMFDNESNLLCIVGWQSPGSVGRRLAEGEKAVRVRYRKGRGTVSEWISPSIDVRSFHSFSGHADSATLLEWVSGIEGVRGIFLVHGEMDQAEALRKSIREKLGIEAGIPERDERIILEMSSLKAESFTFETAGERV